MIPGIVVTWIFRWSALRPPRRTKSTGCLPFLSAKRFAAWDEGKRDGQISLIHSRRARRPKNSVELRRGLNCRFRVLAFERG